jgi:OOP family OmpA-OmpF porin
MRPCCNAAAASRTGALRISHGISRGRVRATATVLALFFTTAAFGEPLGKHFELTQFGGYTVFDDARNTVTGKPLQNALYLGGRLGYHFDHWLGFEAAAGFTPAQEDVPNGANLDFFHLSGAAVVRPLRRAWGSPYLSLGGGMSNLKLSGGGTSDKQGNVEAAAGVQFWLNDAIGVRAEVRDIAWVPQNDLGSPKSNDYVFGAGLTFALGAKPRDTDGDGVPDRADACPNTVHGAKVDAKGCPIDSDGDGVPDGIDQCAATPVGAKVDAKGCPIDSDADGVFDGLDKCPGTPVGARVDSVGCPIDSDGDGVPDGIDRCPGTLKGCTVDSLGCPRDADGDSVCDALDQCPDTPRGVKVDAHGCPAEIGEREQEMIDTGLIRLDDFPFEAGKADLGPQAKQQLDLVGAVLVKWPELEFEVAGHTDNKGQAKANQKLSEARAKAVREYLLQAFPALPAGHFVSEGYGASRPVVPNVSPEAMARNRRIEFVVLNKDVLQRESERRRLEQSGGGK